VVAVVLAANQVLLA